MSTRFLARFTVTFVLASAVAASVLTHPQLLTAASAGMPSVGVQNDSPYDAWVTLYSSVIGIKKQMGTGAVKPGKGAYVKNTGTAWFSVLRVELHQGDKVICDTDIEAKSDGKGGWNSGYTVKWVEKTKKCYITSP